MLNDNRRYFYRSPGGSFGITKPINGEPATHGNGSTIGFNLKSPEQVDAFHAAGVANGGTTARTPGWREGSVGKLYLAYVMRPGWEQALHCTDRRRARAQSHRRPSSSQNGRD